VLHSIRTRGSAPAAPEEPIELLLACHARLRHFSALALALATRRDLADAQVEDACVELLRYFRVALPLHEADEEESLAPALEPFVTDGVLVRMHEEHMIIHEALDELFPTWERRTSALAPTEELSRVLDVHLALEESSIFPLLEALPELERKRILAEIQARRATELAK
jgi:hemerythrin-like domain-containing protein